ncbi:MAG: F0F1 ATP synthase subunit epsilon [Patescibacteria group bacterium]|jgi:F-type H+-transporting ATPase subunit epsilon
MKKIKFEITTPERKVYSQEVDQVTIPTVQGEITVLPGHIPLVSAVLPGELRTVKDGEEAIFAIAGGFIEVLPDKVTILADSAEYAEEIDEKRAEEAKARAEKLLSEKRFDSEEFAALSAQIERELVRIKVAKKKKYRNLPNQPLDK